MSAFGKVAYTENENVAKETIAENFNTQSVVEEQVEKFDNSYSVKLQELYEEYDKVTLDEDRIKEVFEFFKNDTEFVGGRKGVAFTASLDSITSMKAIAEICRKETN